MRQRRGVRQPRGVRQHSEGEEVAEERLYEVLARGRREVSKGTVDVHFHQAHALRSEGAGRGGGTLRQTAM